MSTFQYNNENTIRAPWNKGKLVGQRRPLKLKETWGIRVRLQMEDRVRDLAPFNLAIDSKLRGCDLIRLRVTDVTHGGSVMSRANVMQQKTRQSVQFEITPETQESVSVIYLSFQIRHATKAAEDASFRSVVDSTGDQLRSMIDPSNRGIVLKGLSDYQSLNSEEKFVFDGEVLQLIIVAESSTIAHAAELIKGQIMEDWSFYFSTRFLPYQGFREWWVEAKGGFGVEFQKWMDGEIAKADHDSDLWGIK